MWHVTSAGSRENVILIYRSLCLCTQFKLKTLYQNSMCVRPILSKDHFSASVGCVAVSLLAAVRGFFIPLYIFRLAFVAAPGSALFISIYLLLYNHHHLHAWFQASKQIGQNLVGQHTFINHRHFEGDADDAHQVYSGNQRAQDGTDTQRLTFTRIDKLQETQIGNMLFTCSWQWSLLLYRGLDNMTVSLCMMRKKFGRPTTTKIWWTCRRKCQCW